MGKETTAAVEVDKDELYVPMGDFAADFDALCKEHGAFAVPVRSHDAEQAAREVGDVVPSRSLPAVWLTDEGRRARIASWLLDTASATALIGALSATQSITVLSFWNAGLTNETLTMLAEAIRSTSVSTLCVDANTGSLSPTTLSRLVPALAAETSGSDDGTDLESPWPLRTLSLRSNGFGDDVALALGEALKTNGYLVTLNLANNRITDAGAQGLVWGLRQNRVLQSLSLNGNKIGDKGAGLIASTLDEFALEHDEIVVRRRAVSKSREEERPGTASKGAKGKKETPKKEKRGKSAGKKDIKASTEGVAACLGPHPFLEAVNKDRKWYCPGSRSLAHLNLSYNDIGPEGMEKLLEGVTVQEERLAEAGGLLHLGLLGNSGLSTSSGAALQDIMAERDPMKEQETA
eukprot:m.321612 g.321612  ORF g.321612 m.321612 type:complete len:406 (+) comp19711_c0_seq9:223-1440(+)